MAHNKYVMQRACEARTAIVILFVINSWGHVRIDVSKFNSLDTEFGKTYFEHEYFPSGAVDVKLAVGRVVGVDPLPREEVHNILLSVFVSVCRCHLFFKINKLQFYSMKKCVTFSCLDTTNWVQIK